MSEYNPESVLAELSRGPEPVASVEQTEQNPIPSHWLRGFSRTAAESPATAQRQQRQLHWYKRHRRRAAPAISSAHQRAFLHSVGALSDLPRATVEALLPIYISLLNDLLPIVDGARLFREYSNSKASKHLIKAICLVTAKARQSSPFLRLEETGSVLPPSEFATNLLAGLDAALKADLVADRVTKIQILALMHLHNDGTAGMDRSSNHLCQAISEAWALSLHWKIPGNPDQEQCDYLWWTLRNMDRLNKPIQGAAPFIIDDADVSIGRISPHDSSHRSQVMAISLRLGDLMTVATKVYKASSTATCDDAFDMIPTFDEMTLGSSFDSFHRVHRGKRNISCANHRGTYTSAVYLEIWFHVATMLSCRYSGPGSPHYNRRLASADRILAIASCEGSDGLPPLPLIPYAVSMSTTMIYRAFRDAQRGSGPAYDDLGSCCSVLDSLSQRWTSAKGISRLAKRLLKVLRRDGTMQTRQQSVVEPTRSSSCSPRAAASVLDECKSSRPADNDKTSGDNTLETGGPGPGPSHVNRPSRDSQLPNVDGEVPFQPIENWQAIDASYLQLDRAFGELFDYGMPNVFRDPTTWEYLVPNEEASSVGSDFHMPTYFSPPDMDFGYSGPPAPDSQDVDRG